MSSPSDFVREGQLEEAVASQIQVVKSRPMDSDERFLLFVLLCFAGQLERAEVHLEALVKAEGETRGGASVYHAVLGAEYERQAVFANGGEPAIAPGRFSSVNERIEAIHALVEGDVNRACKAIDRANEAAPDLAGKINGRSFTSICDYDDLLGDIVEVYAGGRYMWIPLEGISKINIEEPSHQLDILWTPAELQLASGETSNVHLPALYPGTQESTNGLVQFGRLTEWVELKDSIYRGLGQKTFLASGVEDEFEIPLLETRVLELAAPNAASGR